MQDFRFGDVSILNGVSVCWSSAAHCLAAEFALAMFPGNVPERTDGCRVLEPRQARIAVEL